MFHFIRMEAGRSASAALDAEANTLSTRNSTNITYKGIGSCFSFHKPPSLARGD
jgi:hypothetical protein